MFVYEKSYNIRSESRIQTHVWPLSLFRNTAAQTASWVPPCGIFPNAIVCRNPEISALLTDIGTEESEP